MRGLPWLSLVCGCLIFGGCGGETGSTTDPPPKQDPKAPQDPDLPNQDVFQLKIVGNSTLQLQQGQQLTIQVVYSQSGKGLGGQPIYFAPKGAYADSRLTKYKVLTDGYGFAETVVLAGKLPTTFTIEASADKDGPVQWSVSVVKKAEPPPPPTPVLEGSYDLTSHFNIKTDFSGSNLAQVLNMLDKVSDDPQDPGKFIVDSVLAEVSNQTVLAVAQLLKPVLYQEVNKVLYSIAPQLVADIKALAQDLSAIARKFELTSTMVSPVAQPSDKPMIVDHTVKKIAWTLNGTRDEYAFSPAVTVQNVQLTMVGDGDLTVAEHSFKIKYGVFLLAALNNLVIPQVVSGANDIEDVLQSNIDCQKVATTMNNTVGIGGEPLWKLACDAGLKTVALLLEGEIAKLDNGESTLIVAGTSKLRDMNKDAKMDAINNGVWTGSLQIDQCIAPLAGTGNFFFGLLGP